MRKARLSVLAGMAVAVAAAAVVLVARRDPLPARVWCRPLDRGWIRGCPRDVISSAPDGPMLDDDWQGCRDCASQAWPGAIRYDAGGPPPFAERWISWLTGRRADRYIGYAPTKHDVVTSSGRWTEYTLVDRR